MATHICENCGHESAIFGPLSSQRLETEYGLEILGKLPLNSAICHASDAGIPVSTLENTPLAVSYQQISTKLLANLAGLPKDYNSGLAQIKLTKTPV